MQSDESDRTEGGYCGDKQQMTGTVLSYIVGVYWRSCGR